MKNGKRFLHVLFLMLIACSDENEIQTLAIDNCSSGILQTVSSVEMNLPGTWLLVDSICGLCGEPTEEEADKKTRAVFKDDKTFVILIDEKEEASGSWSVEEFETFAQVNLTPNSIYLTESLTMCENEFLTSDQTVIDLFQNKFVKM